MKNFNPHPDNFSGSVRCEIVVTNKDFEKLNENSRDAINRVSTENTYSNPRNAASGLTQRLDGLYTEYCTLLIVDGDTSASTEFEKMNTLKQLGFTTVESYLCHSYQDIELLYQKFLKGERKNNAYDIDGLVIKINDLQVQENLGHLNNRPKGQVAYKFPAATDTSRILAIDWQVGPLGTITPVAQIEPVEISGAIITYASLANMDLIEEKGINVGDIVNVSRRGDVIPHIDAIVTKVSPGHAPAPTDCPECHTSLIRDHKFLRCPNPNCPAQALGLLRLFCQVLDIKGISEKNYRQIGRNRQANSARGFLRTQSCRFSQSRRLRPKIRHQYCPGDSSQKSAERSRSISGCRHPQLFQSQNQASHCRRFRHPRQTPSLDY